MPGALLPYESPKIKRGRSLRQSRISLTGLPTSFPDSVMYLIANLYVILRLTRAGLIAILVALSKPIQRQQEGQIRDLTDVSHVSSAGPAPDRLKESIRTNGNHTLIDSTIPQNPSFPLFVIFGHSLCNGSLYRPEA